MIKKSLRAYISAGQLIFFVLLHGKAIRLALFQALEHIVHRVHISETAAFLKYITPFAFCDGADVITNGRLDGRLVAIGLTIGGVGIAIAYGKYTKKDIL